MNDIILKFYKEKSMYTNLGLYEKFAKNLPNDIEKLCILQRNQIIHPITIKKGIIKGDFPKEFLTFEDEVFPTAQSVIAELLRRDNKYGSKRKVESKVHVTCRGQAILLASILKVKNYSSRVRSGFASYSNDDNTFGDHWITEYYDIKNNIWKLVDADCYYELKENNINPTNIPKKNFLYACDAYLNLRNKTIYKKDIYYASSPKTYGMKAAIRALFYDFNCLMNNEIYFLLQPKYVIDKDYNLTEDEYCELDYLANLMKEPDKNFKKIKKMYEKEDKFRIMRGGFN